MRDQPKKVVLGVEGGGTKTEWLCRSTEGTEVRSTGGLLPAANIKLITDDNLVRLLRTLPSSATHVGVFLAGCGTQHERRRLGKLVREVWPRAHATVGSDRDSGFATAFEAGDGIAVISGTGSAVQGRYKGRREKAGGWGQLLGDRGSGYDLAMQGLRYCLRTFDFEQRTTPLAKVLLRQLGLNSLNDLVDWVKDADKLSVARLAPVVFEASAKGDIAVREIIEAGARRLAEYSRAVAHRLGFERPIIRLLGGLFVHHSEYERLYGQHLESMLPAASVELCARSGAEGALWLAGRVSTPAPDLKETVLPGENLALADTEQRNPRSSELDRLPDEDLVDLFISEEEKVTEAMSGSRTELTRAVALVGACLKDGGRLFYVGAGTSGRLGVLDASEIPPTFSASPELVQGIIAGGFSALHQSAEAAEDSFESGGLAVAARGVSEKDVVCGITASGRTPFVLGALDRAREIGARTILLNCNPARQRTRPPWNVEIDLATGPELVTGSTRLKAGTATKLALNIISTCAMVRLGKVKGNLMIDLTASNAKLRDRAARMLSHLKDCSYSEARAALESNAWSVRKCLETDEESPR